MLAGFVAAGFIRPFAAGRAPLSPARFRGRRRAWPAAAAAAGAGGAGRVAGPRARLPQMRYPVGMRFARLLLT
jgi:hypothetical protein